MALCHVTGTVYLPDGSVAARRNIEFYKVPDSVTADYLGAVVPEAVAVRTDENGEIVVSLITCNYYGFVLSRNGKEKFRFTAVVPDAATADFADLIEAADPVEPLPAWLQQAIEARDDARAEADRAEVAAAQAALNNEGVAWIDDVAAILSDTSITYGHGAAHVQAGDIVRTRVEGFAYEVAASGASNHHVTTAGGVKLYVLSATSGLGLDQAGRTVADFAKVADVAKAAAAPVWSIGPQTIDSDYWIPQGGLRGGGGSYDDPATITLTDGASLRAGRELFDPVTTPNPVNYRYQPLRDLTISQSADAPALRSAEGNFQIIENVAFKQSALGVLSSDTPMIELGSTLYNRYTNNYMNHGGGIGIRGVEADYDKYYYGVNASWFEKNNFFGEGTSVQLHGIFTLNYNDFETAGATGPRVIVGDSGSVSTATKAILKGNYFEGKTAPALSSPPPTIEIQKDQGAEITSSQIHANNTGHPNYGPAFMADYAAIKTTAVQSWGIIRGNYCNAYNGLTNVGKFADWTTTSVSYTEFVGNHWPTNSAMKIVVNGKDIATVETTAPAYPQRRVYVRDRVHGEVRDSIQVRDIWVKYDGAQAGAMNAKQGRNHYIASWDGITDIAFPDAAQWVGAKLTIYAGVAITLRQGPGYFFMARGTATVTIPAGRIIEFMIVPGGQVREIGDYTARL